MSAWIFPARASARPRTAFGTECLFSFALLHTHPAVQSLSSMGGIVPDPSLRGDEMKAGSSDMIVCQTHFDGHVDREECVASAASGSSSGERVTVSGQSCVFPSVYRGEVMNDCMDVGGKQQCKTAQGVWEECAAPGAAAVPAKPAGPVTVSGASCVFPLIYRGSVFQTCIEVAGDLSSAKGYI